MAILLVARKAVGVLAFALMSFILRVQLGQIRRISEPAVSDCLVCKVVHELQGPLMGWPHCP